MVLGVYTSTGSTVYFFYLAVFTALTVSLYRLRNPIPSFHFCSIKQTNRLIDSINCSYRINIPKPSRPVVGPPLLPPCDLIVMHTT